MADFLLTVGVDVGLSYDQMQKDISNLVSQLNSNPPKIRVDLEFDTAAITNLRTQISDLYQAVNSSGATSGSGGRGGFRGATQQVQEHTIALRTVIDMYTQMHSLMGRNTNATGTATWNSLSTHAQQFAEVLELVQSREITVNEALHQLGINGANFIGDARVAMSAFRAEVEHTGASGSINMNQMYTIVSQMQTLLNNNAGAASLTTYTELQNRVTLFANAIRLATTENISLESAFERIGLSGSTAIEEARTAMSAFKAELSGATFEEENIVVGTNEYHSALRRVNTLLDQVTHKQERWTAAQNGSSSEAYHALGTYADELRMLAQRLSSGSITATDFRNRISQISAGVSTATNTIKTAGEATQAWGQRIGTLSSKFGTWFSLTRVIMAGYRAVRQMITNVIELDTAMTELKKVTNETDATYEKFLVNATSRAKELGASLSDTVNATADFARLGYGIEDAEKLADAAIIYKNVGDGIEDIGTASESIIATMQAFGINAKDAMSIVDKFNEVGNNYAISSKGVGDTLLRSAAAMQSANNSLDETIALAAAANTVVQDPEKVGTTLKTVSMYLRAAKTDAEKAGESTDGMANSVSELREELLALTGNKVDIQINENTFKSTYQILKELSIVWGELSDVSQANILEMVGGKRNSNVVAALLENFSVADKAIETSANSAGSAAKENEKVLESIQGKLNIMKATFETFSQNFITGDLVKSIIDIVTALIKLSDTIIKIVNVFGGLQNVLIIVGSAFLSLKGIIIASKIMGLFIGLKRGIMNIVGIIPNAIAAWQAYAAGIVSANTAIEASLPVIGLIVAAITILTQAIDWLTVSSKEAIEAAEEINSKFQEQQNTLANNKKTIDSISSDYEKLSKGVSDMGTNISLSTEEYSRYNDIVNQIADMFPTMVKGYTAEGNAIIAHKGNVEELTKAYKEQAKAARDGLISKGDDIFSGAEAELDQLNEKIKTNEAAQWLLTGAKVYHGVDAAKNPFSSDIIQKAEKLLKEQGIERQTQRYANGATEETYALIRPYNPKTQSYDDPLPEDVEVRAEKRNNLERDYNLLLAQRDGILSKTNSVIQAYLENEITYENQNEDIKNFISMVSSSLDPSNFDFDDDKMKAWIKNNVLIPISEASPETKQAISDLFSLDKTKIPAAEWENQTNELINQIVNTIKFDSAEDKNVFVKQLKIHLGFEFTTDGETSVGTMLEGVKEKVQDESDSEVDKLSFDELQIAYKIIAELPEGKLLTWDELKEKIDAATQSSNEMTDSLFKMKTASDNISSISSAFKQLSDDGYITIKTIGEIQEATGLSGDEWAGYEEKLLNAKAGSAEFNQVMSDLTYRIIDNTFNLEELKDATDEECDAVEKQIAAVLRENGVTNANAVAQSIVAKAKNSLTYATYEEINALIDEGISLGYTSEQMFNLIGAHNLLNNSKLNLDDKIAIINRLGDAGLLAASKVAYLINLLNATSEVRTSTVLTDGDRSGGAEIALAKELGFFSPGRKIDIPELEVPTFSGGSSGGGGGGGGGSGSDSNEALDNYLKYVKHKKALGYYDDNTAQYINDLQYALNNLTKTEEEQWDLEEQIYSERENLREEEVSGYESWMSHLESLGYYEDDIAKKINDITWAIENQKLTEEEKFKKEEEIYKLTLDRNEKIRESFENLAKAHSETYNYALSDVERYIEQLEHQKALTDDEALIKSIDRAIIDSMADGITKAEEAINNLTTDADYWKSEIEKKLKELGASFDISKWFDYEGNITSQFESDMDVLNNSEAENVISSWANIVSEKLKSVADNTNQIFEYQEKIFSDSKEAIEESISDIKEAAEEIFELRTSKLNSQSTLLKAQHSLINSIAETQHQLDKDILEAETAGARMSEIERESLFTRDEYNKLSGKLNDVLSEANSIQDEFNRKLKGATLDTIDEITSHYERQYELKMKEYEIVKAELDVAKAQQKLENVENEKSVRQWDGEKWIYTSVLQDVIDAQNELADAKYALAQAEIKQSQTEAIQEIDSKVDSLETQKNLFITALEGLTEGTTSARERLNTALNEIADTDVSLFRNIVSRVGETLDKLGAKISSISIGRPVRSSGGVKVVSGTGYGGIHPVDANFASLDNLKNAYAKGSRHTPKGIGLFDEDNLGSEVLVTKDGVLRQFNAGDTVFNSEMVQRLWDFASGNPIQWNLPNTNAYDVSSYINRPEMAQPVYDNRTYFNGVEVNDADGIRIMKEFATYLKSKV